MSSLLESGVWRKLVSIGSVFSDAPWLSFNTGVLAGKHGSYNFLQLKRGTTDIVRMNARSCRYLPFWSLLQNTDKKAAVFDVPKTYPIAGIDGIQISAWGEEYPLLKQCSLPKGLVEELSARFGRYTHTKEIINPSRISHELRKYNTLMSNIKKKLKAVQFIREREDWDLFMTSFGEAHYANHLFFHHFNKSHWAYDPKKATRLSDALPNIYSELDSALATLLKGVSDRATIFIVSVHGIATNYSANHLMPSVLEKLGFQARADQNNDPGNLSEKTLLQGLRNLIPTQIRDFINDWIVPQSFHDKMLSQQFSSSIDWQKTKAFFLPISHFQGFISINLKGRELCGVVQPGAEYEEICNQICDELKLLVNPETGKPAIREVIRASQIFPGENLYNLPEIIIQWAEDGLINQLQHPKFGLISERRHDLRKTQHSGEGFMIAAGKHINKAAILNRVSSLDLAPTILYLMGQSIPDYMDGRVLLELIDEKFKWNNKVKYGKKPLAVFQEMGL